MDVLPNQNDEVDVVLPPSLSTQRDSRQSPYLQDYNQVFGLPNSLVPPSFGHSFNTPYYSPYSELSYGGEHDNNSNTGLGLRTGYDPTEFAGPQVTPPSLLIYSDNEFMSQFSTASNFDCRTGNSLYDYSSSGRGSDTPSTGATVYYTPRQSPSPGSPLPIVETAVPKPTVTTGRTANANHKRRKPEATFVCPIAGCGSTFTRSFNLKGHIRSHKEEKPFVCHWPGCGKGFSRQHDCKRHEQLHTNFRPFSCDGCGKQFARMDALNRHLRSEDGADCLKLQEANGSNSEGTGVDRIGGGGGGVVTNVEVKGWKALGGGELRDFVWDLGAGRGALCRSLLFQLLKDRDQRARVRQLSGDDAQILVDYLDLACRHECSPQAQEGRRALSLLGKLAKSAGVFPRRYLLQEVKHHPEPVAGGGYAEVFRGEYIGKPICVKAIRAYQKQERDEVLKANVQELIIWAHLQHENIVPLIGIHFLGSLAPRICLVSPWMENGNLRDYLNKFPLTPRMPFIYDIVAGLLHLHGLRVVHRDLKAQNVLVSGDGRALIADFGLSFVLATTAMTSTGGTSRFVAPEILLEESEPTESCDIWSFACLCYEVLTDKLPFYQYKDLRVMRALMDKEIPLRPEQEPGVGSQELNDEVWQLLVSCWNYIPQDRPNCEAIQHTLRDMKMQGNRQTSGMGATKPYVTTNDEFDSIFWQSMKWSNHNLDYVRVETVLRRVQNLPERAPGITL